MADTTATIRLKVVDDGLISTIGNASNAFTGLTIGTTALAAGFKGLQKVTAGQVGQFLLGVQGAEKYAGAIGKVADANSRAVKFFSAASDVTFVAQQLGTLTKGVQDAAAAYSRIPQTLQLMQQSGISTRSIEEFNLMTDAIRGNQVAVDQFAVDAVAKLGQFEQAAARAGTILRSSVNFDEFGGAKRADRAEQIANAFQVQDLVNNSLKNTVSSTDALLGQYEVLSGGFVKAADSQEVLSAGLKLVGIGQAGGQITDTGETLRLITKTLRAYDLGADQAAKTGAILNAVVENGITTIPELSQNFGQAGQTAKAAGVSLTDLAASTSVLTAQGVGTAQSLTGLQRIFANIISKTPEAEQALSKLNLNGQRIRFDIAEVRAKGFTQALLDLNKAAASSPEILQSVLPEDLAFRTALGLLAKDGQQLANVAASIGQTTAKSLDDVFNIATGDRVNRLAQIANRFQELIIKTAQSIAPVFEPGLNALETIASVFNNLPEPVKQAIGQFIAFQITAKASAGAVGILFQTMLQLAGAYLQVRAISLLLTGQLGRQAAAVGQLITQRKGLGAAALQVFGIDQRWRLETNAATTALEKQNVVSKALAATRQKLGQAASGIASGNIQSFQGQISGARKPAQQVAASSTLQNFRQSAGQIVTEVGQSAKNIGLGVGEAVGVVSAPQILEPDGRPIMSGLGRVKQEASKAGDAVVSAFGTARKSAVEVFSDVRADPLGTVRTTAQATGAAFENIKTKAQGAADAIAGSNQTLDKEGEILARTQRLVERDVTVRQLTTASIEAENKALALEQSLRVSNADVMSLRNKVEREALALTTARAEAVDAFNSVSFTQEERSKKYAQAVSKENSLKQAQTNLDAVLARQTQVSTQLQAARLESETAFQAASLVQVDAEDRLLPVAIGLTEARIAQTAATEAASAAQLANAEASRLGRELTYY